MEIFITKIIIFILCFATLNVFREIGRFIQCYRTLEKYEIATNRMLWLWASISFIMTIIFTGIL